MGSFYWIPWSVSSWKEFVLLWISGYVWIYYLWDLEISHAKVTSRSRQGHVIVLCVLSLFKAIRGSSVQYIIESFKLDYVFRCRAYIVAITIIIIIALTRLGKKEVCNNVTDFVNGRPFYFVIFRLLLCSIISL